MGSTADVDEPAFTGNGLDPVLLFAYRGFRREPDVDRTILVHIRYVVGADARLWSAVLQK